MRKVILNYNNKNSWVASHCVNWEETDFHCLACGKKSVWVAPGSEVDYGGGDRHICADCGSEFYGYKSSDEDTSLILKKLREAIKQ